MAIFDREVGDMHVEDCHVATLLAMTRGEHSQQLSQVVRKHGGLLVTTPTRAEKETLRPYARHRRFKM